MIHHSPTSPARHHQRASHHRLSLPRHRAWLERRPALDGDVITLLRKRLAPSHRSKIPPSNSSFMSTKRKKRTHDWNTTTFR